MLLMEYIVLSVVPVGERRLIGGCLLDWLGCVDDVGHFALCLLSLLACVLLFVSRLKVHLVRVDDLGLFFKVESLLMVLDLGLR